MQRIKSNRGVGLGGFRCGLSCVLSDDSGLSGSVPGVLPDKHNGGSVDWVREKRGEKLIATF